jgi:hypothetical protein
VQTALLKKKKKLSLWNHRRKELVRAMPLALCVETVEGRLLLGNDPLCVICPVRNTSL